MNKSRIWLALIILLSGVQLLPDGMVSARPQLPQTITSPSQMIDVVNNLRLSHGLPTLAVHPILMQSSQTQADYMASTGQVTHSRPGGITYTQQLLMLGFPLSGDLSLGGFRAENIISSHGPLEWNGVPGGWQDPDHMNTMLSQNFTHIGAGISQRGDSYYYAVDCAAVTGSGQMQSSAPSILTTVPGNIVASGDAAISQFMVPVSKSTARPGGDVVHKVQYGQTLWSIAIEYGTTIKDIQALNNLGEDLVVYQGQELLVLKGATQPAPATPASIAVTQTTSVRPATSATFAMPTMAFPSPSVEPMLENEQSDEDGSSSRGLVVLLIVAAFVGGGVAVWLIRDPVS
jgi:LysM repeat protein